MTSKFIIPREYHGSTTIYPRIVELSKQLKRYRNYNGRVCEHFISGCIKYVRIPCRIEGSNKIKDRSYSVYYNHYNKYLKNLNCR
jgi:hypothetical protein